MIPAVKDFRTEPKTERITRKSKSPRQSSPHELYNDVVFGFGESTTRQAELTAEEYGEASTQLYGPQRSKSIKTLYKEIRAKNAKISLRNSSQKPRSSIQQKRSPEIKTQSKQTTDKKRGSLIKPEDFKPEAKQQKIALTHIPGLDSIAQTESAAKSVYGIDKRAQSAKVSKVILDPSEISEPGSLTKLPWDGSLKLVVTIGRESVNQSKKMASSSGFAKEEPVERKSVISAIAIEAQRRKVNALQKGVGHPVEWGARPTNHTHRDKTPSKMAATNKLMKSLLNPDKAETRNAVKRSTLKTSHKIESAGCVPTSGAGVKPIPSFSQTKREIDKTMGLYNLWNRGVAVVQSKRIQYCGLCVATSLNPKLKISFNIGLGNNPGMVERIMYCRGVVEKLPRSSLGANLQWTPYYSKHSLPTLVGQPHKLEYGILDSLPYMRGIENENPAELSRLLTTELKLFHLGTYVTPLQILQSFNSLVNPFGTPKKLVGFACENTRIANHLQGMKSISRKGQLLGTMESYFSKQDKKIPNTKLANGSFLQLLLSRLFLDQQPTNVLPPTVILKSDQVDIKDLRLKLEQIDGASRLPTSKLEVIAQSEVLPASEGPAGIAFGALEPETPAAAEFQVSAQVRVQPSISEKSMWIVKPGENANRGSGIKVAYSIEEATSFAAEMIQAPDDKQVKPQKATPTPSAKLAKRGPANSQQNSYSKPRIEAPVLNFKDAIKDRTVVVQKYLERPLQFPPFILNENFKLL